MRRVHGKRHAVAMDGVGDRGSVYVLQGGKERTAHRRRVHPVRKDTVAASAASVSLVIGAQRAIKFVLRLVRVAGTVGAEGVRGCVSATMDGRDRTAPSRSRHPVPLRRHRRHRLAPRPLRRRRVHLARRGRG
eukprot:1549497-Rhodomonas_salina.1